MYKYYADVEVLPLIVIKYGQHEDSNLTAQLLQHENVNMSPELRGSSSSNRWLATTVASGLRIAYPCRKLYPQQQFSIISRKQL